MTGNDKTKTAASSRIALGHDGHAHAGDPKSWVDEHGDALFRYALLRVRERASAEDVVQETFLAAVKSKNEFQGGSQVRTWLIGILRHKIGDYFRKNGREIQVDGPDDADPVVDSWFDRKGFWLKPKRPRTWDVNPAELAERQEFWLVLQGCMDALPGRAGEAFSLRVVNDTEPDEVCKVLGITTTNLWVLLHRARARLRACLEEKWFGRQPKESA